jgi:hypothetical protein
MFEDIHKTASIEDNHLETDVCSTSSGTDAINHQKYSEDPQLGQSQLCDIA